MIYGIISNYQTVPTAINRTNIIAIHLYQQYPPVHHFIHYIHNCPSSHLLIPHLHTVDTDFALHIITIICIKAVTVEISHDQCAIHDQMKCHLECYLLSL